jgi:hypothetical protein
MDAGRALHQQRQLYFGTPAQIPTAQGETLSDPELPVMAGLDPAIQGAAPRVGLIPLHY